MGNLFTSLINSTNALNVYSQALEVVQNDVTNSSTPGYVKQTANFQSLPFDVSIGLPGGVSAGPVLSSRDPYAELNIRTAQSSLGYYQQQTTNLAQLSSFFDVSGKTGIGPAINDLFNSFSQLSVNPNDTTARQGVLSKAASLAQTIQQTAQGLQTASLQTGQKAQGTVAQINNLASRIAQINSVPRGASGTIDAGMDAQLNNALEELSQYANFTALQQPDGSVNIYLGGQTSLVTGNQAHPILASAAAQLTILDSNGKDISSQISHGQLAGMLDVANNKLPSYTAGLNTLAAGLADQVNAALNAGVDLSGAAPAVNLFTYDPNLGSASTLAVNPAITMDQLAAALPGAPGGNGNALALASMANSKILNGMTFAQFYGELGSQIGTDIAGAQSGQDTQTQILTQAQNIRSQVSGVSLDEEAQRLMQFQNAYQATAKMVTILDSLTSTVLGLIPS